MLAVAVLTVDYGRPPWIALALALSFGLYGLMKKLVRVEAAPGLFVETAVVFVPALVVIGVLEAAGDAAFGHEGAGNTLLLASTGLATAIPLLLFAAAARRVPLSTVGLLQYVTPLMQLSIGVFVYEEPMPPARWPASPSSGSPSACSPSTASARRTAPVGRPRSRCPPGSEPPPVRN